jgi:putative transposase
VAIEKLQVKNLLKNRRLAKSISDASWSIFTEWLKRFGHVYGKIIVEVNPKYTSQKCSNCSEIVKKSLSVRTHICQCGCILDRDENAAINILKEGLKQAGLEITNTVGHTEINAWVVKSLFLKLETILNKDTL